VTPLPPILTAHLLPRIEAALVELLRSLTDDDWERPTVARAWRVKDVAAHLLDTHLRKLSFVRDRYRDPAITADDVRDLTAFVNRMNHEGVAVYRRLSPPVLIELMARAGAESAAWHQSLDPDAEALFAVSWAGEARSANWFDTAREYTERWHHQQQIRLATNRPGIMTPELYFPVLDCFMRALPHAFRSIAREAGTVLVVDVTGECGGRWWLERHDERWRLVAAGAPGPLRAIRPAGAIAIPQDIAWRVFTKGIDRSEAARRVETTGDRELAMRVLETIAIVG
jgi:uncharacterized protein (TIGR03083 family)